MNMVTGIGFEMENLDRLMRLVQGAYDADGLFPYDFDTHTVSKGVCGDGLLDFICEEIVETYIPGDAWEKQRAAAQKVMDVAGNQLDAVANALWFEKQ